MAKTFNQYAEAIDGIYTRTPKSVLAAIAVSALTFGEEIREQATARVASEWLTLYENGIVPQKPPSDVLALAKLAREKEWTL
jgi:hypothetical protein